MSGLYLRPYKACDAPVLVRWVDSEKALRQWTADRFLDSPYPLSPERFHAFHRAFEDEPDSFPMTAFDKRGAVAGHILLRWPDPEDRTAVRLGFVIVDSGRRGQGLGRQLVTLACRYAFAFLGAERITLGVFTNNPAARRCYAHVGFLPDGEKSLSINSEDWLCTEMVLSRTRFESLQANQS